MEFLNHFETQKFWANAYAWYKRTLLSSSIWDVQIYPCDVRTSKRMTWNCPCISTVPEPGDLGGQNGILQKRGKRWNARCGQSWHQDFRDFRSRCMELSWNSSLI
jgi:hypothetical protein